MKIIEIASKVKVENKKLLALVYTPGVAKSSTAIYEDYDKIFDLTNSPLLPYGHSLQDGAG